MKGSAPAAANSSSMNRESNLVSAGWLARRIGDPDLVVVDCRYDLTRPEAGRAQYAEGHIPGAFHLDLETDLSGRKQDHGGRHPLPEIDMFCRTAGSIGIDDTTTVVAYDGQNGGAARLWWMLRYLGHRRARVLDGGWSAWRAGNYPVSREVPVAVQRAFVPRVRSGDAVDLAELIRLRREGVRLVDSRTPERYRGEVEPIDPVAGHIPDAANLPWTDNIDEKGFLKPVEALKQRFGSVRQGSGDLVVYCGSGVTACVNLLAMDEAGISGARLYVGGWSDWCSNRQNPVAKEDPPAKG
jgi:thiosulfate/3-mercaptopyruvate sulfurtransferase